MQEEIQEELFDAVEIDSTAKATINSISSWAMIGVITSILSIFLSIIELFTTSGDTGTTKGVGIFTLVITTAISGALAYFLYRFAKLSKSSILSNSADQLSQAFSSLRTYFTILAVLLMFAFLVILIVFAMML